MTRLPSESTYYSKIYPRLKEIREWKDDYVSDPIVAERLDVPFGTLKNLQRKYPELGRAMQALKKEVDPANKRRNDQKYRASTMTYIKNYANLRDFERIYESLLIREAWMKEKNPSQAEQIQKLRQDYQQSAEQLKEENSSANNEEDHPF